MNDFDLENCNCYGIVEELDKRRYAAIKKGEYKKWYDSEYEQFFKALAEKTEGSALWNERFEPCADYTADEFIEMYGDEAAKEAVDGVKSIADQATWLIEIGKVELAGQWLEGIEDTVQFASKILALTEES